MNEKITPGPWRACTDPNDMPQLLYSGLIAPIFYSSDEYVAVVSETADVGGIEECRADAWLMAAAPLMREALEAEEAAQWYYAASIGGLLDEYGRELCKRADQLRREALAASTPPALREATPG